jgi:hypothetical protein
VLSCRSLLLHNNDSGQPTKPHMQTAPTHCSAPMYWCVSLLRGRTPSCHTIAPPPPACHTPPRRWHRCCRYVLTCHQQAHGQTMHQHACTPAEMPCMQHAIPAEQTAPCQICAFTAVRQQHSHNICTMLIARLTSSMQPPAHSRCQATDACAKRDTAAPV